MEIVKDGEMEADSLLLSGESSYFALSVILVKDRFKDDLALEALFFAF